MRNNQTIAFGAAAFITLMTPAAALAQATLTILQPIPPGTIYSNSIRAINHDGSIAVGGSGGKACMWRNGVPELLPLPAGATNLSIRDLSDDGSIVVGRCILPSGLYAGLMWVNGALVVHEPPAGSSVGIMFNTVSADGSVVFGSLDDDAARFVAPLYEPEVLPRPVGTRHARIDSCTADGSAAAGVVQLTSISHSDHLVVWTAETGLVDHGIYVTPHGCNLYLHSITDDGATIIGTSEHLSADDLMFTFEWSGEFVPPSENEGTRAISGNGLRRMIQSEEFPQGIQDIATPPTDVRQYLQSNGIDLTGWSTINVQGLSGDGTALYGTLQIPSPPFSRAAFVVTGLPAPSTGLCLANYNGDGDQGDIVDFLDFFDDFGQCDQQPSPCGTLGNPDLNGDTIIDILDFLDFLDAFGQGC